MTNSQTAAMASSDFGSSLGGRPACDVRAKTSRLV